MTGPTDFRDMSTSSYHPFAEALASNELLAGLSQEAVNTFASDIPCIRYDDGAIIFREGDPPSGLFLVVQGSVLISKQGRGGKQETLGVIEAGGYFGEMALVDHQPRSAQAMAQGDTMLGVIDEKVLQQIIQSVPEVSMNLVQIIVKRLRAANTHFIEEMMRSERLSLVGSMANGIIHDFKNPIAAIMCACDFIQSKKDNDPTTLQLVGIMRRSVDRMLAMTQELLDFSRGTSSQKWEKGPISKLIADVEEASLQPLEQAGYLVDRRISFDEEVVLDFDRFERVLGNLIKNAREAMPAEGGKLIFEVDGTDDEIRFRLTDNGCGIPEDVLPTIFEPFVTHGKKNGTGLGMAMVKNVIEGHRGKIEIDSRQNEGTTITIHLPRNLTAGTEP